MEAFELALRHGCDGFEFDVRYTSDGRCVICHDALHRRRRIRARSFSELSLPAAEEVVRNFASRAFLDIELKVAGDAAPIHKALRDWAADRYVISSFLPDVLRGVAAMERIAPLGLICENLRQLRAWPTLPVRTLMLHLRLATASLIEELHSAKKEVFVWTVNKRRDMERLASLGVEAIISDDTQLLVDTLKSSRSQSG
ncbi:MAG TPA: glycerophosphodiester phosphodiesterase, partial [Terriglobales bacterium]|nr:glycerophosphodiester phosphodiesterase [Terriglobales bacterium]